MSHILDMPRTPVPVPTEKAQIVVHYTTPHPSLVVRYNDVKTAKSDYEKLCKFIRAWAKDCKEGIFEFSKNKTMFECQIDISYIATVMLVEHAKRDKFVPIP